MQKLMLFIALVVLSHLVKGQWSIEDRATAFIQTSGMDTGRCEVKGSLLYLYFKAKGESFSDENLTKLTDRSSDFIGDCVLDSTHAEAVIVFENEGRKKNYYRSVPKKKGKTVDDRIKLFRTATPLIIEITYDRSTVHCTLFLPAMMSPLAQRFCQGAYKIARHYIFNKPVNFHFRAVEYQTLAVLYEQQLGGEEQDARQNNQ